MPSPTSTPPTIRSSPRSVLCSTGCWTRWCSSAEKTGCRAHRSQTFLAIRGCGPGTTLPRLRTFRRRSRPPFRSFLSWRVASVARRGAGFAVSSEQPVHVREPVAPRSVHREQHAAPVSVTVVLDRPDDLDFPLPAFDLARFLPEAVRQIEDLVGDLHPECAGFPPVSLTYPLAPLV